MSSSEEQKNALERLRDYRRSPGETIIIDGNQQFGYAEHVGGVCPVTGKPYNSYHPSGRKDMIGGYRCSECHANIC
jgi:hypothetical protein